MAEEIKSGEAQGQEPQVHEFVFSVEDVARNQHFAEIFEHKYAGEVVKDLREGGFNFGDHAVRIMLSRDYHFDQIKIVNMAFSKKSGQVVHDPKVPVCSLESIVLLLLWKGRPKEKRLVMHFEESASGILLWMAGLTICSQKDTGTKDLYGHSCYPLSAAS